MWLLYALATMLMAVAIVATMVPICDIPYSPFTDEFTVAQAATMYLRAELRKRRAATANDVKAMMLGLDDAGKSSLVEYWVRGEVSDSPPAPTSGFNIQELNEPPPAWWQWKGGVRINLWELGGAAAIRPYWSRYFDDPRSGPARAVVFVVDGADASRLAEAEAVLRQTLAPGALPAAATTLLLCFAKADTSGTWSGGWNAGEPGAPLHAAICEWQQAGSAAGRSIRKVETMKISVRQGCPTGTAGARTALQWIRNNAE